MRIKPVKQRLRDGVEFLDGVFQKEIVLDVKREQGDQNDVEGEKLPHGPHGGADHAGEKRCAKEKSDQQVNEPLVRKGADLHHMQIEQMAHMRRVGRIAKTRKRCGNEGVISFKLFGHGVMQWACMPDFCGNRVTLSYGDYHAGLKAMQGMINVQAWFLKNLNHEERDINANSRSSFFVQNEAQETGMQLPLQ